MLTIGHLLNMAIEEGASDLHLVSGGPPRMRIHGNLVAILNEPLSSSLLRDGLLAIMSDRAKEEFSAQDNADFAYVNEAGARFRVNVFRHFLGIGAAFRLIPRTITPLDELGLPAAVKRLCYHRQGLVLITGKTGSGKTTTLASMIDEINGSLKGHIVTIEDPVEYLHERKLALISQRELGAHTRSFSSALTSALREDPDVILIGELRDLETMQLAVTAAETGHLMFATLHTNGAASAIERAINLFPANKHGHVRNLLSTSLRGVLSQQLLRTADGKGRVAVLELLINTPAIANLIRDGRTDQLDAAILTGSQAGMKGMDASIYELVRTARITEEEAYQAVRNKAEFRRKFGESG